MRKLFTMMMASAIVCALADAQEPDSQSLGDVARHVRQQKQKNTQTKGVTAPVAPDTQTATSADSASTVSSHVVTNEEIPEQASATTSPSHHSTSANVNPSAKAGDKEAEGERWRDQIQQQKAEIASLQQQIDSASQSIQYAGANCVANCAKWNEHQEKKQEQVDSMKSQLEEMKGHLEEMQETARKQGYGSSIYDP